MVLSLSVLSLLGSRGELNRKRESDRDAAYESWDDSGSLGPATERDALSWLRLRLNASAFWLLLRGVRGDSTRKPADGPLYDRLPAPSSTRRRVAMRVDRGSQHGRQALGGVQGQAG